jgi:capsular polysaccharide biosynthesis protein
MILRNIVKAVLPRYLRKQLYLVYNRVKIETWDRIFFKSYVVPPTDIKLLEKKNPFMELNPPLSHLPEEIKDGLRIWQEPKWFQDQYIIEINEPAFIEPEGWGITADRRLIYESLGFSTAPHVHKPSTREVYSTSKQIVGLKNVISLRDTGEENYFHFFNDIIPKLFLLKDHGYALENYTIVISEHLYKKSYFKLYHNSTWLSSLKWYVQSREWISFEKAVFCKPYTHTKKYFEQAVDMVAPSSPSGNRKIFLTRGKSSGRYIENMDEIEPVLGSYGFDIIDSARLSFEEQIHLFSNVSHLIGVHGAGLTNMLFRKNGELSVLELLHPFEYVPFHYIMMANMFGHAYDAIIGSRSGKEGFVIAPQKLTDYLKKTITE